MNRWAYTETSGGKDSRAASSAKKVQESTATSSEETQEKVVQNITATVSETEQQPTELAKNEETKILDPFMVYKIKDIFEFTKTLSAKANFTVKTSGKFILFFSEANIDINAVAEFLQQNPFGYYWKAIQDYPIISQ